MDILELIKKHGAEIPEAAVEAFNKDFRASYKSAAEHKKVKDDLTAAQSKLDTASDFEGKYNTLFRKYETDIAAKDAVIEGLNRDSALEKALGGIEFISSRVKDSVVSEIKAKNFKLTDGKFEGLEEHLKELQKNEPDIFVKAEPFKKAESTNTWSGGSSGVDKPAADSNMIFGRLL